MSSILLTSLFLVYMLKRTQRDHINTKLGEKVKRK